MLKTSNDEVKTVAEALNSADEQFLDANKNPSRKVREIDNRGSHFHLALYWAQNVAACGKDELKARVGPIAAGLTENEGQITQASLQFHPCVHDFVSSCSSRCLSDLQMLA